MVDSPEELAIKARKKLATEIPTEIPHLEDIPIEARLVVAERKIRELECAVAELKAEREQQTTTTSGYGMAMVASGSYLNPWQYKP